jgi:hypothetical protein
MTHTVLRLETSKMIVEDKENLSDVLHRKSEVSTSPTVKRPLALVANNKQSKYDLHEFVSPLKKRKTARQLHCQLSPPTSPTNIRSEFPPLKEAIEEEIHLQQLKDQESNSYMPRTMKHLEPVQTKNEQEEDSDNDDEDDDDLDAQHGEDSEQEEEEEDDYEEEVSRNRRSVRTTQYSNKVYDSVKGTTCHQCKQKTMDRKQKCSICANTTNSNIRGCFCGSCLRNRYGEDIDEVLTNENWVCPICRNICNCSSCRRKACKNPVSITTREALKNDYKSVYHYLLDKRKTNSSIDI